MNPLQIAANRTPWPTCIMPLIRRPISYRVNKEFSTEAAEIARNNGHKNIATIIDSFDPRVQMISFVWCMNANILPYLPMELLKYIYQAIIHNERVINAIIELEL